MILTVFDVTMVVGLLCVGGKRVCQHSPAGKKRRIHRIAIISLSHFNEIIIFWLYISLGYKIMVIFVRTFAECLASSQKRLSHAISTTEKAASHE